MRPVSSSLRGTAEPLTRVHDVALLDLDGVVYVGPDAIPGAAETLAAVRDSGMRLAFVTNNAARPPHDVADHLTALGIPARPTDIITSAQAAARFLAARLPGGARVLVVGTTGLDFALRERGLVPVADAQGQVDAVVQGYSPDLTWGLLAEGAIAINRDVPWIATNVDPTVPSPRGPLPGNGSLVAALRHATGHEPVVTGKPDPTMHRESVLRSEARRPIVVGDRLDTDIEGANAVGCPSLLVFTGVTTVRELLAATQAMRPTFVSADLGGLLIAHPEPELQSDGAECGRWRVRQVEGGLMLAAIDVAAGLRDEAERRRDGDRGTASGGERLTESDLDAVRALCAALWDGEGERLAGTSADIEPGVRIEADDDAAAETLERLGLGG
jgi:glycerol-1-phosphatase